MIYFANKGNTIMIARDHCIGTFCTTTGGNVPVNMTTACSRTIPDIFELLLIIISLKSTIESVPKI